MNIIIMGAPGSGKTTQAALLAKQKGLPHIQAGEIYRRISQENTPLGRKVKEVLDRGGLIDDETTFQVVDRHLVEFKDGFVIDGFPRTLIQAEREVFTVDKVFYLRLSDQQATQRLQLRARPDETTEIITERLREYHRETEPVLDYYRKLGKLIEVAGSGSIEEVFQLILQALND